MTNKYDLHRNISYCGSQGDSDLPDGFISDMLLITAQISRDAANFVTMQHK
jgi:hypothetical protein